MKTPLTPYQRRLFALLGVATFFEGYDMLALSQILPNIRAEMALSDPQIGLVIGVVNIGTMVAYLLVRRADRWGRKRVLMITIAGYTIFTFLTALSPEIITFTIFQFIARIFLIGEWAVSMVYAAEEFPADRRGMVLGVIQGFSSVGAVICAATVPMLLETSYGWRSVYFLGIIPLVLVAFARRSLEETRRFQALESVAPKSFFSIWRTAHKRRLLQVSLIWVAVYAGAPNAVTFWKEFVMAERGLSNAEAGATIAIAAVAAMPMLFLSGKLLDVIGRKPGAAVIFATTAIGMVGAYGLETRWPLTVAVALAMFGVSAMLPVMNAFTSELFPTEQRGNAFAWANTIIGRSANVFSPIAVSLLAESWGWGPVIRASAIFPIVALILILWLMPETKSLELEQTAELR